MTTRRDFLHASTLLSFGATVPGFLGRSALAARPSDTPGGRDTVLVVVQLTGGNDGLNTVVPRRDPLYLKHRPKIGIKPADALKLTDDFALHPAMTGLAGLYADGKVAVVHGVGYPNPDQSHFRSMDIWHAGSTAPTLTEGWLGRGLKQRPLGSFHISDGKEPSPLALAGATNRVPSIASLADYQLKVSATNAAERATQKAVISGGAAPTQSPPGDLLDFVRRTATTTYAGSDRLQALAKGNESKVPYPATGLATRLKLAAQLIDAGVGARVLYVSHENYDTHAGQGNATGAHANLLGDLSAAITAFTLDVAARGHGNRVCLMTFSEFGRRAKENGSGGTDHGSGAPMLLVGGKVKAGLHGTHPSLEKLDEGNLIHTTDFRHVYAALLDTWLGLDAKTVLGSGFPPLAVV